MRINYNVSSIIARNALNNNDRRVAASTQKLSSGYKINSAADNAAGLAIARKMNAQIRSLQQANRNANDGLSVVNTADGAMAEMHDIMQRMNELAIQSANGTNAVSDREMIQKEIDQLVGEIDRIASTTQFNAQSLLDGSFAFKSYTNTENIKVKAYSEGVASGTYAIGKLTYYHYENITTKYEIKETEEKDSDGKVVNVSYSSSKVNVTQNERYEVDNEKDNVLNSLVTSATIGNYESIDQIKAFPDGSKVMVEDENIVIKAENDFEIKIKVNDREPLGAVTTTTTNSGQGGVTSIENKYDNSVTGSSAVTTTSYSAVITYRNIAVTGPDGKRYDISEINFFNNVDSKGNPLADGSAQIYTGNKDDNGRDLRDDFVEYFKEKNPGCSINIEGVAYDDTAKPAKFTVTYATIDGKTNQETKGITAEFTLFQDKNDHGVLMKDQKELKDYKYSETMTTRTKYEIGKGTVEDCITLDVTGMGAMIVQVGANEGQYMELEFPALTAEDLGLDKVDLTTEESARLSIDIIGDAINQLSSVRAKIGAYANRLEHTITNLDTSEENITSAYSRIMDVDMATEMTEYSTVQVLVQASTSMLAQANERPQQVLQLLQ
ncbi:flagellin FlaB1 [Lachnospiraceae bacterium]|nr:flagellin FlaB1 [Lachnospiraceae bacterium]